MRNGVGVFKAEFPAVLADESNDLTLMIRAVLAELWEEFKAKESRVAHVTEQIEAIATRSEIARRLTSIPGVGKLSATAIIAAVGDAKQFKKGRDLAAWLGLVPAQRSTGGQTTLLAMSKRGNSYVRKLLLHGARSCLIHLDRSRDRLGPWLDALQARMHFNKVVVALANKLARIVWVFLTRQGALYSRTAHVTS